MELLQTSRRVMTWLGMVPVDEETSSLWRWAYITNMSFAIVTILFFFTASGVYAYSYFMVDFDSAIFDVMTCTQCFGLIYSLMSGFKMRDGIKDIYTNLSTICNTCKCDGYSD